MVEETKLAVLSSSEMTCSNLRFVIITFALFKLLVEPHETGNIVGLFYLQNSNFICNSMYTTTKTNMSLIELKFSHSLRGTKGKNTVTCKMRIQKVTYTFTMKKYENV